MSTKPHPIAPEEVMALLDGELSAADSRAVSAHIRSCSECGNLSQEFQRTKFNVAMWQVVSLPEAIEDRVQGAALKLSQSPQSSAPRVFQRMHFWSWKQWFGAVTATAALALVVLAVFNQTMERSSSPAIDAGSLWREQKTNDISVDRATVGRSSQQPPATSQSHEFLEQTKSELSMSRAELQQRNLKPVNGRDFQQLVSLMPGPMIARTVSLAILVRDFDSSRVLLDTILARHNGYAANLSVSTPQDAARSLQASLRIPAPQLAGALAELKALGRVELENQNGEEVTQQHADLVARLKNSRETEQRLQAILTQRTGKISDVLEVEQEIARVRGEIEQMEAEQKNLEHRVDFATIDLKLSEEYKAKLDSPAPAISTLIHNAAVNGYRNVADTLLSIVLFFAEYGPVLAFWLLLFSIPAWLVWRRWRHATAAI
jgi:hypothetical protein